MSGYYPAVAGLSAQLAELLAAGPPPPGDRLPAAQVPEVLGARDVVAAEVAALVRRLIHAGPASAADLQPGHLVTDPAHVLHAALYDLPRAAGAGDDQRRWTTGTSPWAHAARAAASFEHDHERLAALPGPAAWQALRDAAALAAALPHLDADLAARLPPGHGTARNALAGPGPQALVGIAAGQLRYQLADLDADGPAELLDPTPPKEMVLRSAADLPEGMRRLAAVLDQAERIAAVDVRAVATVLTAAAELARADLRTPAPARHALSAVQAGLRPVQTGAWDTVSPRSWRLQTLTTEIHRQLRDPTGPGLAAAGGRLGWAAELRNVVSALAGAVERTAADRRVAVPRDHLDQGRDKALLWVPLPPGRAPEQPLLAGLDQARTAARQAQQPLTAAYGQPETPAKRGALAAGRALTELQAALRDRQASSTGAPPPDRPAHPARRHGWTQPAPPQQGR